ncbi:MAG: prolipoprotein diacylglyceryl transferase [Tenericutes bacterium]|jgi:phosphatidylglycerol:prolipoprotein diacylglycerol transferase|nr:prolipoprotein diacylglyceryl transferase [Mycoplasmatota bacterium]
MYPFLLPEIFDYTIPMHDLMMIIGVFFMLIYVAFRFEKRDGYSRQQTNKLLGLIVISSLLALVSAFLVDGIFHSIENGELTFGSITFLGGLIGGVLSFLLLIKYFFKDENKDIKQLLNTLITGVVLAHAIGRIGCFLAGCCFGIPTDSFLGVVFPYGYAHQEFPDIAIYPTQLFESAFLFILFVALNKVKSFKTIELEVYLIAYGTWRFFLEFIRGDDRGSLFGFISTEYTVFPTPSQYISVLMVVFGFYLLRKNKHKKLETKIQTK